MDHREEARLGRDGRRPSRGEITLKMRSAKRCIRKRWTKVFFFFWKH